MNFSAIESIRGIKLVFPLKQDDMNVCIQKAWTNIKCMPLLSGFHKSYGLTIPDWLIISGQSFYLYEGQQQLGKENVACSTHSRFQEAHCSHNHHIAYNFVKEEKAGALSARGQQTKGFGFWRRVYTQPPQWLSCSSGPLSTTTTIFLHLHTTILVVEEWSWPQWSFILLGQFMEWRETIYKV